MDTSQSQGLDIGRGCFEDPEVVFDFDALLNCDFRLDSNSPCDHHDSPNSDSDINSNHTSIAPELAQRLEACIASGRQTRHFV
ncbi:hypothetical protein CSOJ01_15624 [Colletotrichum sojae]|uniref:Uncharacterized protein n=1 Tax=Colletotrichum sojae TaxID=2175907 RepID=A0A8H6IMS4_9PEZI|nr:hypothetical protein CSOJ01_15624 [Colletotrichum sojae]